MTRTNLLFGWSNLDLFNCELVWRVNVPCAQLNNHSIQSSQTIYPFSWVTKATILLVHVCICLFACDFVYLRVYLFICVCICLFACVFVYLRVYMFICVCICLFACVFVYLHVYLFICVCIWLFVCVFVYLRVYLFICVCICLLHFVLFSVLSQVHVWVHVLN